jgi:hypothetical protein
MSMMKDVIVGVERVPMTSILNPVLLNNNFRINFDFMTMPGMVCGGGCPNYFIPLAFQIDRNCFSMMLDSKY